MKLFLSALSFVVLVQSSLQWKIRPTAGRREHPDARHGVRSSWGGPFRRMFPEFEEKKFEFAEESADNDALFLTPLLKAGKYEEAQRQAKVTLPGGIEVESYSGYFTVNKESCHSNMFMWFFPSLYNSENAPTLLWLQGGPGGTSLFGLFVENGPFKVLANLTLEPRPTNWVLTHNLLYVDNPVGTGFSFTRKDECYAKNEVDVASDLYEALQQFFTMFPNLRSNPFYVTGESYAGKYVPAISYKIHEEQTKKKTENGKINFKGMAIGDGLCDPVTMMDYGNFLFTIGLIDEVDRDYFEKVAALQVKYIRNGQYEKAFQVFDDLLNGDLGGHPSYFANVTGYHYYFNYLMSEAPEDMGYYNDYVQQPHVRRSIHVGNETWNDGKTVETHLINDVMQSVKPWIEKLTEHYKVMIYNGMMDIIIAWPLTENFIRSMKWSGAQKYLKSTRTQWHLGEKLAGYVKQVGNFTQVIVRNAGHMVPYDQPSTTFDMINRFTYGKKFD